MPSFLPVKVLLLSGAHAADAPYFSVTMPPVLAYGLKLHLAPPPSTTTAVSTIVASGTTPPERGLINATFGEKSVAFSVRAPATDVESVLSALVSRQVLVETRSETSAVDSRSLGADPDDRGRWKWRESFILTYPQSTDAPVPDLKVAYVVDPLSSKTDPDISVGVLPGRLQRQEAYLEPTTEPASVWVMVFDHEPRGKTLGELLRTAAVWSRVRV